MARPRRAVLIACVSLALGSSPVRRVSINFDGTVDDDAADVPSTRKHGLELVEIGSDGVASDAHDGSSDDTKKTGASSQEDADATGRAAQDIKAADKMIKAMDADMSGRAAQDIKTADKMIKAMDADMDGTLSRKVKTTTTTTAVRQTTGKYVECLKNTGRTCWLWGCHSSSVCKNAKCLCGDHTCADGGIRPNGKCTVCVDGAKFNKSTVAGGEGHDHCGDPVGTTDLDAQMAYVSMASYFSSCTCSFSNPSVGWVRLAGWLEHFNGPNMDVGGARLPMFGITWETIDAVGLFKKGDQCAVAFAGSDDSSDWVSNVFAMQRNVSGGGLILADVHNGFWGETDDFLKSPEFRNNFVPTLASGQCSGVNSVGHSLGGAQAALFAAAINYVEKSDNKHYYQTSISFKVKQLFTIGAPAPSRHQLRNPAYANGVFAGSRTFAADASGSDVVPWILLPLGFEHPRVKAVQLKRDGARWKRTEYAAESKEAKSASNPCVGCVLGILKMAANHFVYETGLAGSHLGK